MEILLQQIINGLVLGSMYALVALGYTMVRAPTISTSPWAKLIRLTMP